MIGRNQGWWCILVGSIFMGGCRKTPSIEVGENDSRAPAMVEGIKGDTPVRPRFSSVRSIEEALTHAKATAIEISKDEVGKITEADPLGVLKFLNGIPEADRRIFLPSVLANFPPDHTAELAQWLDESAVDREIQLAAQAFSIDKTYLDFADAVALASDVENSVLRGSLLSLAAARSFEKGIYTTNGALFESAKLEGKLKSDYMTAFLVELARHDVRGAVSELVANRSSYSVEASVSCLSSAGMRSPDQTAAILAPVASLTENRVMVGAFIGGWLECDSISASQWVSETLSGDARDFATIEIANFLRNLGDVASARKWIENIESDEIRNSVSGF